MKQIVTQLKIFIIFFSLLQGLHTHSQDLEGSWISSYRLNIQQRTTATEFVNGEFVTRDLDQIRIDTFYHTAGGLINFLPEEKILVKGIGGSQSSGSYAMRNDTIIATIDTIELKLITMDKRLLMVDLDSGWQLNQFVIERLSPKPSLDLVAPDFEKEPYWKVEVDSNSINHELELFVLDSINLIISQFTNSPQAQTFWGDYKTDVFEDNLYIYIQNTYTGEERTFRLFDRSADRYSGQNYELGWVDEPPQRKDFILQNLSIPAKKALKSIKRTLIGSWILSGNGVAFDPELSDYKRIEDEFFYFTFSKETFNLEYGAKFINENQSDSLSEKLSGTWSVGQTGKFLELKLTTGEIRYLSVIQLSDDFFTFNLSLKTADSDGIYPHSPIELKRGQ